MLISSALKIMRDFINKKPVGFDVLRDLLPNETNIALWIMAMMPLR